MTPTCTQCGSDARVTSRDMGNGMLAWSCKRCRVAFAYTPRPEGHMATTGNHGKATDDELPPVIRALVASVSELLQAGTRLLNAKADVQELTAKGMRGGR